jgi:hypothetical protein
MVCELTTLRLFFFNQLLKTPVYGSNLKLYSEISKLLISLCVTQKLGRKNKSFTSVILGIFDRGRKLPTDYGFLPSWKCKVIHMSLKSFVYNIVINCWQTSINTKRKIAVSRRVYVSKNIYQILRVRVGLREDTQTYTRNHIPSKLQSCPHPHPQE